MNKYIKELEKKYLMETNDPCDTYMENCYECPYEDLCEYLITKEVEQWK